MKPHEFPPIKGAWVRKLDKPQAIGVVIEIFLATKVVKLKSTGDRMEGKEYPSINWAAA
jgi:hypothetical protein